MPPKKTKYWSRAKKQKQLTTARLMEISLKVDDHIYKHKLISVLDAELYLKEVVSYKTLCSRDERSQQVIEKLTRCMKAIILDHQEQRGDSREESNMREDSPSPVYSMPDEDRTYLTQPDIGGHNCTEPSNDVEIIDLVDSDDDGNSEAVNATAEGSRVNVEVDLHRGMSSLSLKDTEPLDTTADVNCSQSILNNFEDIGKEIHLEKTTVHSDIVIGISDAKAKTVNFNQTAKEVILPFKKYNSKTPIVEQTDNLKSKDDSDKTTNPIRTHCTPKSTMTTVTNQPKGINTTANVLTISPIEKYNTNTNNISVTQRSTWYDSNKTSINNFSHAIETHPTNTFERANQMNISTAKNLLDLNIGVPINPYSGKENSNHSNTPETLIDQENLGKTKKKRCPRKKVSNENGMKPKNQRASISNENRKTGPKKNKSIPIYNRNVENDLSWVENIRYVREIREDENDTKLIIEDSFWDSYYLPSNWNETDFLY